MDTEDAYLVDKPELLKALRKGEINLEGQFMAGSNYTFLGQLTYEALEMKIVYKPVRGEQPLWDFPRGSLGRREVAAYILSEALAWQLVPPTVYRKQAPMGPGSVQQYIEHDPNDHYFNFGEADQQRLRPAVLFDILLNNADRKGGHVLRDLQDHLWLIDHGLCFHVEDKLRTVIWNYSGEPIPPDLMHDLESLLPRLSEGESLFDDLARYLRPGEIHALSARARRLIDVGCFPLPPSTRRSYPWPPV